MNRNKELLKTRLKSIQHYTEQIKDLESASQVTRSTRTDLINSLAEFCPFEPGQLVIKGEVIMKVVRVIEMKIRYPDDVLCYVLEVLYPDGHGRWKINDKLSVPVEDTNQLRVLYVTDKL